MDQYQKKALVWFIPALFFFIYGYIFLVYEENRILENAIIYMQNLDTFDLPIVAIITILLGATYTIGTLLPFATIILFLPIVAKAHSNQAFIGVILAIFTGWVVSTFINIFIGKISNNLKKNKKRDDSNEEHDLNTSVWVSWVPTFRANDEVTQTICNISTSEIFKSSLKVKVIASLGMTVLTFTLGELINLSDITSKMGYVGSFISFAISIVIIFSNLLKSRKLKLVAS